MYRGGDQPDRVVEAGRRQHRADRRRHVVQVVHRLPAEVGGLADRLRGELRRRDVEEHVGARALQRHHLAVDRRVGDLVAGLRDDHRLRLVAQPVLRSPSGSPCRSRRSGRAPRSSRSACFRGCAWRSSSPPTGSSAASPSSTGSSSDRPTWWRRWPRTVAAPSSLFMYLWIARVGRRAERLEQRAAPPPPPPACAPAPRCARGCSHRPVRST